MKDEITVADDLLFDTAEMLKRLDEADVADDRERTRRELAIYKGYFGTLSKVVQNPHADGKTETARAFVGRHIHPAYTIMFGAIPLYTNDAADIPTKERIDFFSTFDELMLVIGARWNDCANAALNVRACFDDVSDKIATLDDVQAMTKEAAVQFMVDIDGLRQRLRQGLIELSAVLTDTPADRESELLAAIQDVRKQEDEHHKENMDAHGATHARLPKKPRADKGGKHKKRTKISGAWRTAKEVAEEFTQAFNHGNGFTPKGGKRKLGILTEPTVNSWDVKSPDFQHKNKWGYYAELRIKSDLKKEYYDVLGNWLYDLEQHRLWDKQHPGVKYRRVRRVDIDPATQIGEDENGKIYTKPKSADEIRRIKKVAGRAHVRLHKGWK